MTGGVDVGYGTDGLRGGGRTAQPTAAAAGALAGSVRALVID